MANALLQSEHFHIDPYLHQMMPSILTCLVGRRLCDDPSVNDHWELRNYAAEITGFICKRYGDSYSSLQPRITKTLHQAFLDVSKPLTTHYGAIVGLSKLGTNVIQMLILPNVSSYMKILEPERSNNNPQPVKRQEAQKCYEALLHSAGQYLQSIASTVPNAATATPIAVVEYLKKSTDSHYNELYELFGESVLQFVSRPIDSMSL